MLDGETPEVFGIPLAGTNIEHWCHEILAQGKIASTPEAVLVPTADSWDSYAHLRTIWAHGKTSRRRQIISVESNET